MLIFSFHIMHDVTPFVHLGHRLHFFYHSTLILGTFNRAAIHLRPVLAINISGNSAQPPKIVVCLCDVQLYC